MHALLILHQPSGKKLLLSLWAHISLYYIRSFPNVHCREVLWHFPPFAHWDLLKRSSCDFSHIQISEELVKQKVHADGKTARIQLASASSQNRHGANPGHFSAFWPIMGEAECSWAASPTWGETLLSDLHQQYHYFRSSVQYEMISASSNRGDFKLQRKKWANPTQERRGGRWVW